ncbi:transmembrane 220 family protein [Spirosoma montaniterrae]|uniref:Transmembrane family 220, helix n=1 Tax=Spirosoma montaniterrae TaxID=1178516 RepID=A0A1P9WS94_9BACT|nr:transmembrane 220 family protein [Spirosoma montaniterrae]AQG78244.1 hypothetical protein AWR27_02120 [Spirosoma montaniterrae]
MRKTLSIVFGLLFVLFAAFQYNDPDPEIWVPIYGAAAVACFMAWAGVGRWWFFAGMAGLYFVATWYQWPSRFEGFLFNELGMRSLNIELAREAGGLGICAAVMVLFAVLTRNSVRL